MSELLQIASYRLIRTHLSKLSLQALLFNTISQTFFQMSQANLFSVQEIQARISRIRQKMKSLEIDAVISSDASNVRYTTGFKGEPRTLLILLDSIVLYTSFRTISWACQQTRPLEESLELSTKPAPAKEIKKRLPAIPLKIAIDQSITAAALFQWQKQLAPHQVESHHVIETIRQTKSPAEIAIMQQSQQLNEEIFNAILPQIHPGMTERGIQGLILSEMATREEIEGYSFNPIVACGPGCWEIHHLPDPTVTRPGDLLLIDHGIFHQGYASDMTRVVCLGEPSAEMREVHQIVNSARQAAIDATRPGVTSHELDRIARDIIEASGHGKTFTHGLGHSIGLQTHDPGLNLSQNTPEVTLEPGMALTIEPGIYLENQFGIRIEDTIIVTPEGSKNLTSQQTEIIEL
jgi:Xaa-Pro aminopeptidase